VYKFEMVFDNGNILCVPHKIYGWCDCVLLMLKHGWVQCLRMLSQKEVFGVIWIFFALIACLVNMFCSNWCDNDFNKLDPGWSQPLVSFRCWIIYKWILNLT